MKKDIIRLQEGRTRYVRSYSDHELHGMINNRHYVQDSGFVVPASEVHEIHGLIRHVYNGGTEIRISGTVDVHGKGIIAYRMGKVYFIQGSVIRRYFDNVTLAVVTREVTRFNNNRNFK